MNSAKKVVNISVLTAFLFVISILSYSQEDSSKKAEEILAKASEAVLKMSFKSRNVQEAVDGQKNITIVYQRSNPDGTVWMRMESIREDEKKGNEVISVILQNDEGMFNIAGKTAVKMAYLGALQNNAMNISGQMPLAGNEKSVKYSLSEKEYNRIPCYVVAVRNILKGNDKDIVDAMKKSLPDDMKKIMDEQNVDLSSMIPSVMEYYIGKKDNFIYSMRNYNKNGKIISKINYENVELNIEHDEKLFKIPEDMNVKVANSITEYSKYMFEGDKETTKKGKGK